MDDRGQVLVFRLGSVAEITKVIRRSVVSGRRLGGRIVLGFPDIWPQPESFLGHVLSALRHYRKRATPSGSGSAQ